MNEDLMELVNGIAKRMAEIDDHASKSICLTGDDYNLLWAAILGEFYTVGVDLGSIIKSYQITSHGGQL